MTTYRYEGGPLSGQLVELPEDWAGEVVVTGADLTVAVSGNIQSKRGSYRKSRWPVYPLLEWSGWGEGES